MGSREGIAARIETETTAKLNEMNKAVAGRKDQVL